jgi:polysaccharide biosynthesis protein PslH
MATRRPIPTVTEGQGNPRGRLSILFLAPRVPWPLDTGGKIRTFHVARALAARHRVRLLTFGDAEHDGEGRGQLESLGIACELIALPGLLRRGLQISQGLIGSVPVSVRKYQDRRLHRRVRQLARSGGIDLLHCDHLHMGSYGPATRLPFVVDEHNIESVIWDRFARDRSQLPLRRLVFFQQAFWMRRLELDVCRRARLVLVCSSVDQQVLRSLSGAAPPDTRVVPNGVDVEYFGAPGPAADRGHLVFTGSMDWAPNENAVLAFLDEIWPSLRSRLEVPRLLVVGRSPSARLLARARPGEVVVTGTVPDVRPYLREALALVVPMRVGGGTRLKILEAFAAGVPVISTAIGIEGIDALPGVHYLLADRPSEFATAAGRLRSEPGLRATLTDAARQLARERYSWSAVGGALADCYSSLLVRPR